MYQIIGVQRNTEQRLLATPESAREALSAYSAELKNYRSMIIHDPSGAAIDEQELRRRATEEETNA